MPSVDALSLYQVGVQSAFGTAVAATAQLVVPKVDFDESGVVYQANPATGQLIRNRGFPVVVSHGTTWRIEGADVYYEQLQTFFNSFIKGGVAAAGVGPYTWTFVRSLTADPDLDYLTLERRAKDFSTNEDIEVVDCLISSMTFEYAENQPLKFSCEGFGRKADDSSTLTASLTGPTPEFAPSALSRVYIDGAFANLGTTQITGQVIGWRWTMTNGAFGKLTADGRSNLDYTVALTNPLAITLDLQLTVLMDPTRFTTEANAAKNQTVRAISLEAAGTSSRSLKIGALYTYKKPNILTLGEQDGQVIAVLDLHETRVSTDFMKAVVVNNTAELDGV